MNQSSSKSKPSEKKSKTSGFIAKLLKKMCCFHLPSDTAMSEEDVADHHEQQQQQQKQPSDSAVSEEDVAEHHEQRPQQQRPPRRPPQQLVICYGGVGVNAGSMKSTEVPMKYVSSSVSFRASFRALLEQSGVELETTLERGWVVIWCEFTQVEYILKLVESIVKGKEREKKSTSSENM